MSNGIVLAPKMADSRFVIIDQSVILNIIHRTARSNTNQKILDSIDVITSPFTTIFIRESMSSSSFDEAFTDFVERDDLDVLLALVALVTFDTV